MRRRFISLVALVMLTLVSPSIVLTTPSVSKADTSEELDAHVDAALDRFRKQVTSASDFLNKGTGVLIIPQVKKVGLVVGAQWGEGALLLHGQTKPSAYYKMEAGSAGFQAGYQTADFVFVFLTEDALVKFRAHDKWTAGAESGITMVDKSFGGSVDTLKSSAPIAGFMVGKKGLMGGWSVKGTKFTRFNPDD